MMRKLIVASVALADTLAQENAALLALDLPRAASLLTVKTEAVAAFTDAQRHSAATGAAMGALDAEHRRLAEQVGARLRDLAEENRRLLDRAIHTQGRVLAMIAKALPTVLTRTPRYGVSGNLANGQRVQAVALSARV
jgi:hypothetical protein